MCSNLEVSTQTHAQLLHKQRMADGTTIYNYYTEREIENGDMRQNSVHYLVIAVHF